jgi:hypothetical protein
MKNQKSKYNLLKLYTKMQRIYLLDIAKNHDYSEDYLSKLELKLEEIERLIIEA